MHFNTRVLRGFPIVVNEGAHFLTENKIFYEYTITQVSPSGRAV
jgi:hypothetical protein